MSTIYTKEQWSNLSIQDRIKAMNKAVVKGDESIPIEDQASTHVLDERPKRTSVVDMWRQRENSSSLSAQASVQTFRSHEGQSQSEISANSINSVERTSLASLTSLTAQRTKVATETMTSNSMSTEALTSSQVITSTKTSRCVDLKSNELQAKNGVVHLNCFQETTAPSSPSIRKSPRQRLHPHNNLTIIDDAPEQCQQSETMKFSVVDRWNKRGLTGPTTDSPHTLESTTTDVAHRKELRSKNNLGQKSKMSQQSFTQRKSTSSWKSPESTRDTITQPPSSWQKPSNTSPFQLKPDNSVQQLNDGSTALTNQTHYWQQSSMDSQEMAVQASSISDGTPSLSHCDQDSQAPQQQPQNQLNRKMFSWQKPVMMATPVTNPTQKWQKPTVINEVKPSLQIPRDWQKSLRPTGVQMMSSSLQQTEETIITIPSWKKNRDDILTVSASQNPTESFGMVVAEQEGKEKPIATGQKIIFGVTENSIPSLSLTSSPNTLINGKNPIDTDTKDEAEKKIYTEEENQEELRFLNEENTLEFQDTLLQGDDGVEGSSALYIWKQRESLLAQSLTSTSSSKGNSLIGKASTKVFSKKAHQLAPVHKMASPSFDIEVNDDVIGKDFDGLFKQPCAQITTPREEEHPIEENTCGALEWPTTDETESVLQPLVHANLSPMFVHSADVIDEWKATSCLISDEEIKLSPTPIQSNIKNYVPETWEQLDLLSKPISALDQPLQRSTSAKSSITLEICEHGQELNQIEGEPPEQEREVWHKPPAKSLLMTLGKRYRSTMPSSLTGSVEEKKDGDDSAASSLIKKDQCYTENATITETSEGTSEFSTEAHHSTSPLKPEITKLSVVNPTTTSLVEKVVAISYRRKSNYPEPAKTIEERVDVEENEPGRLPTKANDMGHPQSTNQIIESPTRKLSRTVEKKRVQQHRHKLKQGRNSDQSVSSVEGSASDIATTQCSLDIVPDRFELAKNAKKVDMVNSNSIEKGIRSDYPYSPPVDYGLRPRYEMDPNSSLDSFVVTEKTGPSHPLKVKSGQSAFSSPTNACGAFSLYSRIKPEEPYINTHSLYIPETTQGDFSPRASDTSPNSNHRSFSYRSTNRFKHNKELAARAKLTPTNANECSNMSDTGQSDGVFPFFGTAFSGYSAKSVELVVSSTIPSSTLASRASLVLKGRRNKSSVQSPEEKSTAKDFTHRMLQGQPSKQPPCRDRTAAYAPSHRRDSSGGNVEQNMAQRVGLSGRYNSSARFSEISTPQGPLAHNFRYSTSNVHPQNTYSFGSHTSENSSNIYSLASSRSEGSETWTTSDGTRTIHQKHSASTEGTRSVQVDLGDQGFVDKIANFENLQSAYRGMDITQIALDLKEEVQTSFQGSVKEVTAIMTALLANPIGPDTSSTVATANVSNAYRNRATRPEADDDEEVAIEVQYIGEEDGLQNDTDLSNLVGHSSSETEYRSQMSLRAKKEGDLSHTKPINEQIGIARRGLV